MARPPAPAAQLRSAVPQQAHGTRERAELQFSGTGVCRSDRRVGAGYMAGGAISPHRQPTSCNRPRPWRNLSDWRARAPGALAIAGLAPTSVSQTMPPLHINQGCDVGVGFNAQPSRRRACRACASRQPSPPSEASKIARRAEATGVMHSGCCLLKSRGQGRPTPVGVAVGPPATICARGPAEPPDKLLLHKAR